MKIKFFVDYAKATEKELENGWPIGSVTPRHPVVHHAEDAGIDLFCPYFTEIGPQGMSVIDTFVKFEMPPCSVGLIWPRGGDTHLVGSGVIDTGYRGTIKVRVVNYSYDSKWIESGESLGQMVLLNKYSVGGLFIEETLNPLDTKTERGTGGRINQAN